MRIISSPLSSPQARGARIGKFSFYFSNSFLSSRKNDLKTHVKHKHQEQPELANQISAPRSRKEDKGFCCPVPSCPSGYSRRGDLIAHMRHKHAIEESDLLHVKWNKGGSSLASFVHPDLVQSSPLGYTLMPISRPRPYI